jgi:hypothetical protein
MSALANEAAEQLAEEASLSNDVLRSVSQGLSFVDVKLRIFKAGYLEIIINLIFLLILKKRA